MRTAATFDHIAIIYNPNSTGDAPRMAETLARKITKHHDEIMMEPTLTPTKRARHAEELAERLSLAFKRPLIISVSGDGGYNEVINGAMKAKRTSKQIAPVVAVVGAGNANDHRRVTRDEPLIDLIREGIPKPMDLLLLNAKNDGADYERYAHSYIGFGISSHVAAELNRNTLNFLRELLIILRSFFTFKPFEVVRDGISSRVDSLIFANINEMAKVLKLDDSLDLTDNKFEIIEFAHAGRMKLLGRLFKAAAFGIKNAPQATQYSFSIAGTDNAQLDGELDTIPYNADVTISSAPKAIDALY